MMFFCFQRSVHFKIILQPTPMREHLRSTLSQMTGKDALIEAKTCFTLAASFFYLLRLLHGVWNFHVPQGTTSKCTVPCEQVLKFWISALYIMKRLEFRKLKNCRNGNLECFTFCIYGWNRVKRESIKPPESLFHLGITPLNTFPLLFTNLNHIITVYFLFLNVIFTSLISRIFVVLNASDVRRIWHNVE